MNARQGAAVKGNARAQAATKGAIRIQNVDKAYYAREGAVQAVSDCSLDICGSGMCLELSHSCASDCVM